MAMGERTQKDTQAGPGRETLRNGSRAGLGPLQEGEPEDALGGGRV